jgi:hypothetical protein
MADWLMGGRPASASQIPDWSPRATEVSCDWLSVGATPQTITLDGYAASHRAAREMKTDGQSLADTKAR